MAASTIHTTIVEHLNKWNAPIDLKIESLPWYRFLQSICFCAFLSIFCTAFTVLSFNILSLTYSFYHHSLTRIVFPFYIIIHKTISYIKALSKSSSGLSLLQLPLREKVRISLYFVRIRENRDQKNLCIWTFSHSVLLRFSISSYSESDLSLSNFIGITFF